MINPGVIYETVHSGMLELTEFVLTSGLVHMYVCMLRCYVCTYVCMYILYAGTYVRIYIQSYHTFGGDAKIKL